MQQSTEPAKSAVPFLHASPDINVFQHTDVDDGDQDRHKRGRERCSRRHYKSIIHDESIVARDPKKSQTSSTQTEQAIHILSLAVHQDFDSVPLPASVRRHSEPVCRTTCDGMVLEKKQKLYKTELCRNWIELNRCRYGEKCQYAHGSADLRQAERHPKYKTQICRTFQKTGSCPYGIRCTFRHPNPHGYDERDDMQECDTKVRAVQDHLRRRSRKRAASLFCHSTPPPCTTLVLHPFCASTSCSSGDDDCLHCEPESLLPHTLLRDLADPPLMALPCFKTPKNLSRDKAG